MRTTEPSPFKREQLLRGDPINSINVTPYPLSTSTEMAMAMSTEAQTLQVNFFLEYSIYFFYILINL